MSERAKGLGLRAQIALILGTALSFACAALFVLTLQLERASVRRAQEGEARALLLAAEHTDDAHALLTAALASGVPGLELQRDGHTLARAGTQRGPSVLARAHTLSLRMWTNPAQEPENSPWAGVLLGYFALTGGFVVLLALLALTRLIVSPVANLTEAAELLEAGALGTRVPVSGAREVAQLGLSFNRMARQLAHDRDELAQRLGALERATNELGAAQEQVVRSEKLASVGRLAAGLAHEIGNPLSAILGLVELLRAGGLSAAEHDEFLARVHGETERIHRVLRELLDFARQRPSSPSSERSADLAQVVRDAVRLLVPQADARTIRIAITGADEPRWVAGGDDELSQVVLNLLLNATDAIAGEGVIDVTLEPEGDAVVLTVRDSGPGIASSVLHSLFEPFVTTKPEGKGTGLGLAVCQGIVSRLGGTIDAQNSPAGGATLRVRVPRAAA